MQYFMHTVQKLVHITAIWNGYLLYVTGELPGHQFEYHPLRLDQTFLFLVRYLLLEFDYYMERNYLPVWLPKILQYH